MFERQRPDALFCVNDLSACGTLDVLRQELGLRVPQDVKVIGHDAIQMGNWSAYRLTSFTIDIDVYVESMLYGLENRPGSAVVVVPPRLIERGSTA